VYKLTLSVNERKAIDWIDYRYSHGYALSILLWSTYIDDDNEPSWYDDVDIIFTIPEHTAWKIRDIVKQNNYSLECFSDEFRSKLIHFCEQIV
jgi:hypothetical protein